MHIPTATYRVQLGPGFGFRHLAEILDYLSNLGISDIYASPLFQARPESTHGYDVLDPGRLNPELGTGQEWRELTQERQSRGMGWLQDIVPNHMAYSGRNPYITEMLEQGAASDAAAVFDIQWNHPDPKLKGRVSAPFLGTAIEDCLKKGELTLDFDESGLFIAYYDHRFPLALKSYPLVFGRTCDESIEERLSPDICEWLDLVDQLSRWKEPGTPSIGETRKKLWSLFSDAPDTRQFVSLHLQLFNTSADPLTLASLLDRQFFHLDFWQNAARAINYRRFFSINELIAVRQEDPRVFEKTHSLIIRMVRDGTFSGLRVDHVDGLLAPALYLDRLREACGDCYLIVEKILAGEEELPRHWPVQGTTGYEFAAHLDRLFTRRENESRMNAIYNDFCGPQPDFEEVVRQSKGEVLRSHFGGDLDNLVDKFKALPEFESVSAVELCSALSEVLIGMPIYRSYLSQGPARSKDTELLAGVTASARTRCDELAQLLSRIEDCLVSGKGRPVAIGTKHLPEEDMRRRAFGAFEQLSTALAAKGVEDTALYRYHRLVALNEVGGEPQKFGESREAFHRFAERRSRHQPHALNALSTHDSKRCVDVRARLLVLSEMPDRWAARVTAWREMNRELAVSSPTGTLPDAPTEYFLYQTLAGTCPLDTSAWDDYVRRIVDYMIKACREAKLYTNWSAVDRAYEEAISGFIHRSLAADRPEPFQTYLLEFSRELSRYGNINALAQTLIQLSAPGIPDIYQGTELKDDSLVDPDNRRPVDYSKRRRELDSLRQEGERNPAALTAELMAAQDPDRIKLYLLFSALQTRRRMPDLFAHGDYRPVTVGGRHSDHAFAFARTHGGRWCITVVPRFSSIITGKDAAPGRTAVWGDTYIELPPDAPESWRNIFTGKSLSAHNSIFELHRLFTDFPVAFLTGEV